MATTDTEQIQLRLPAEQEYVRVAQLTAGALAGRIGFDPSTIDSLFEDVAKACASVLAARTDDGGELDVLFEFGPDTLTVRVGDQQVDVRRQERGRTS